MRLIVILLFVILPLHIFAAAFDQIEKRAPHYFEGIFDHQLYSLNASNDYDGPEKKGIQLSESVEKKLERLENRKRSRVKNTLMKDLENYQKQLSQCASIEPWKALGERQYRPLPQAAY